MPSVPHVRRRSSFRALVVAAAALAVACRSDAPTGPGDRVAAVLVTATRHTLAPGDTLRVTAQVLDPQGRVLPTEPVVWSSSTPAVARVDGDGLVTADSVGATTISATAGGKRGDVDLGVQTTVLCDCVVIVDSTRITLIERNDSTGVYVFRVLQGPAPTIAPGDILVGAEGGGYLRRVEQVSRAGDLITVQTTQALVEEAVRDGEFDLTSPSDEETGPPVAGKTWWGPWRTVYVAPGVDLAATACCSLNDLGFSIKINPSENIPVQGSFDFTVKEGEIVFAPRVRLGGRFGFFELKEFHTSFRGDLGLNIDLYEVKLSIQVTKGLEVLKKESQTFIIQQRPFATFIGPMPLVGVVNKILKLEVTPTVGASTVFTGHFRTGLQVEAGVRWTSGGGWRPIRSASSYFDAGWPEFQGIEGRASVKIAVVPELNVLFYGVVGPFVNFEPYAEAGVSAITEFDPFPVPSALDWETKVDLGLNLNMGAKLSVLGRKDLFEVGFAIPIIRPYRLAQYFSDGPLLVRTSSVGEDIPPTYGLRLRPAFTPLDPPLGRSHATSTQDTTVAANDTTTLLDVRSGSSYPHRLQLVDVAGNCALTSPNPDTVVVGSNAFIGLGGAATDTGFTVDCIPLGDLRVATLTSGRDIPERYAVTVERLDTVGVGRGDTALTIEIPGGAAAPPGGATPVDTVVEDFIPVNPRNGANGKLAVTLIPGRRNCAAARPTTSEVVVQSGDTVATQFLVTCVPLGAVRMVAATADPDPPAAGALSFASQVTPQDAVDTVPAPPPPLAAGDSTMVGELVPLYNASGAPGRYTVGLASPANRCREVQAFGRAVTVLPGDTAIADFAITCVERLHVITRTTGPGTDPDGYTVVVDNAAGGVAQVVAGVNDTVGIAGVPAGSTTVRLEGVETSCVAPPPVAHAVSDLDSSQVVFDISCPAPAPPTGLRAVRVDATRVDLAWDPSAPDSVIAGYRVYRDGALLGTVPTPTFSEAGLPPFTEFRYQVSAVNTAGLEGVPSEPLTVRTLDATPPDAPTGLVATAVSATSIALGWQPASDPETGIAAYTIYRDGIAVGTSAGTAFADTGLTGFASYRYEVTAVNGDGLEGPASGAATARTLDGTPPTAPTDLTATPVSSTVIDVAWSAADDPETGVARYQVYRDGALVGTAATTTFRDTSLRASTVYSYTVTAVNGDGLEGPPSDPVAATTAGDESPPTAPTDLAATPVSSSRIDLGWGAAADPESGVAWYRLYRDGALVDSTGATALADTGLTAGTTYRYEVAAVNGVGLEGPRSNPASATTFAPDAGDLVVIVTTTGSPIPEGYTVLVQGDGYQAEQPVAANGSVVFGNLVPQTYSVELRGMPSDCRVTEPNPRSVTVPAGDRVETVFAVRCEDDV